MKDHAVPWWLMTEDLPDPNNRVTLDTCPDGTPQIKLSTPTTTSNPSSV